VTPKKSAVKALEAVVDEVKSPENDDKEVNPSSSIHEKTSGNSLKM